MGYYRKKNNHGIDCAKDFAEISPVKLFVTKLNEFTGMAVSPQVSGVRHRSINIDGDQGCAVTLVPESGSGPHMAKFSEDRYYKRSGDRFYRMEHFDLEDMFGRRQKPLLKVFINHKISADGFPNEEISLSLKNDGRAIAKYAGILATF